MEKYKKEMLPYLRRKFNQVEKIDVGYGDLLQDIFVLSVLDGKEHGTYLEIGGAEPIWMSNSYILEKDFGWTGISVEIEYGKVMHFNSARKNQCIWRNALHINYSDLLKKCEYEPVIDYLSLDIEPPENTFAALTSLPHNEFKFRVITFEHDVYTGGLGPEVRVESRKYLAGLGYVMVVNDVAIQGKSVEDWYVHPDYVSGDIIEKFSSIKQENNEYYDYFLDSCPFVNN